MRLSKGLMITLSRRSAIGAVGLMVLGLQACGAPEPEEPTSDEALSVTAGVPSSTVEVGGRPVYRIDVEFRADLEVAIPFLGEEIGGLEVAEAGGESAAVRGQRRRLTRWFRLRADRQGSYILPAVEITARKGTDARNELDSREAGVPEPGPPESDWTARTPEVYLDVVSVLPEGGGDDIRDVKPVREMSSSRWPYFLAAGMLLLLVATFAWWRWRRRAAATSSVVEPEVPAHEWALAELERLERFDFSDLEALRAVYFELSAVVRTYVERRFALNATDLTTEEIVQAAHRLAGIDSPMQSRLTGVLMAADRVKFARRTPATSEIAETWEGARHFILETAEPAGLSDSVESAPDSVAHEADREVS